MHLVQLFLPLYDNDGAALPRTLFTDVRRELTDRFGGLTAYTRAPVEGLWEHEGDTTRDDLVIYEVMTDALDRAWWRAYRARLEEAFRQERLVVRAQEVEVL